MKKEDTQRYIKDVENRITPGKVATVYQGAELLRKLPLFIQKKIITKSSKADPYMGFVVEPYSLFLAYEVDESLIGEYLPAEYELEPVSIFDNTVEKKCAIIGCFNVHTSVFWGSRFELYLIARNKKTGLVSWLICDYESNTINYDPGKGFLSPTLKRCIYTTSYDGELICDIESKKSKNKIKLIADIKRFSCIELNKKLWIEGNLSIDYSGELDNSGNDPFGLIFDPNEMKCAQLLRKEDIEIENIDFLFIDKSMGPFEACCFQYAQHYITTIFPRGHEMKDESDLENRIKEIIG
jgi:hypothetical protein